MTSTFFHAALIVAIFISITSVVISQAPGDFDKECDHQIGYPVEWKILFDSNRYERLAAKWEIRDLDNDFETLSPVGGICTPAIFSCVPPPQNNWIFSQLIHTLSAEEIFINVTLSDCFLPPCTNHISFHINSSEITQSNRADPAKYEPLVYTTKSQGLTEILLSSFQPKTSGFHFGIKDDGFCGSLSGIIMYYRVCPAKQVALVNYPETPLPPKNGPVGYFEASCVKNAHNVTSLMVEADPISGVCRDATSIAVRCECNLGYFERNGACRACSTGMFGTQGGKCVRCPSNSMSNTNGSSYCQCLPGFYRGSSESLDQPCSAPPSAAGNLTAIADDSSVALTWAKSESGGRSDVYYSIAISDPSNLGMWITIDDHYESSADIVSFTVTGLLPDTSYDVRVVAHNGVSDKNPASEPSRTRSVIVRTRQGAPGVPTLHRFCNVIIWSPPNITGGVLTGYNLKVNGSMPSKRFGPNENFYLTSDADKAANVVVQIQASNAALSGPWSEPMTIGCENQLGCNINGIATTASSPGASSPPSTPASPLPSTSTSSPSASTISQASTTLPVPPPSSTVGQTSAVWSCLNLKAPSNGGVSVSQSIAKYSCDNGYDLHGTDERICTMVGWSGIAPSCVVRKCKVKQPHFFLDGSKYLNNSQVKLEDIGVGNGALRCQTTASNCCRGNVRIGEFYYPNNQTVGINADRESFYRNRGDGEIRLNRRPQSTGPVGRYRCEIPDGCDEIVSIFITIS